MILLFLAAVIFVEAVTELICKSSIFHNLNEKVSSWHPFLDEMLGCGYCTSVWVSMLPASVISYLYSGSALYSVGWFIVLTVVIHRLSNYVHNINDKYFSKIYDGRMRGNG